MIKAIAIDDEPVALDVIKNHAGRVEFIDLVASFSSAKDAYLYLQENPDIQLVFLDINMPDISGLEFVEKLNRPMQIVFTTAYTEYALKGFELEATDYLLKPIDLERFYKACKVAETRLSAGTAKEQAKANNLFIKDGYNWVKINFDNLLYVEANDNYLNIYEADKRTMTRMTLQKLLLKLPEDDFIQVHKSYIVAKSKIEKTHIDHLIINGMKIPVSATFRKALKMAFS